MKLFGEPIPLSTYLFLNYLYIFKYLKKVSKAGNDTPSTTKVKNITSQLVENNCRLKVLRDYLLYYIKHKLVNPIIFNLLTRTVVKGRVVASI